MSDSAADRILGGSPFTVLVRLAAASLLVGAAMSWLGVDALDLLDGARAALAHLYGTGFAALHGIAQTALAGAALVVPVWMVMRLLSWRGPRPGPARPPEAPRWPDAGRARD